MDLHDAATFFDNDPILDGYSGAHLFDAQSASFNDSSSDGSTNRRRVLSTGPTVTIPARRCISIYGEKWLVGTGTSDGFLGDPIRLHFNTKRVTDLLALLTPAEALAAADGTSAYAQKMYLKDTINALTDSEYDAQWNIFVAPDEPAGKGTFLRDESGRLYRVRNDYLPTEGLRILQTDELELDAMRSCTFDTGSYDPVTETRSAGTTVVPGILVDTMKFYRLRHVSDDRIEPGDLVVFLPTSITLKPGMLFSISGAASPWRILTVQPEIDAQAAHVRLA